MFAYVSWFDSVSQQRVVVFQEGNFDEMTFASTILPFAVHISVVVPGTYWIWTGPDACKNVNVIQLVVVIVVHQFVFW